MRSVLCSAACCGAACAGAVGTGQAAGGSPASGAAGGAGRPRQAGAAKKGGPPPRRIPHAVDGDELGGEKADAELAAQGVQNRPDEQRAEKALGHGPQGVDAVALGGDHNVLPPEKSSNCFHIYHLFQCKIK